MLNDWMEIDASLLEERRSPVPAFPLDLLPAAWSGWLSDTARSAGAPADYAGQALLAAVCGLCGAGVVVQVTPSWCEPLVLWLAAVGRASSGRSPAMASARWMLAELEEEAAAVVADDARIDALLGLAAANRRGALLWRDEPSDWLAPLSLGSRGGRRLLLRAWSADAVTQGDAPAMPLAASIVGAIQPDRLAPMLQQDADLAARFLFAWPHLPTAYCPLAGRKPADDQRALGYLRRLARQARAAADPLVLGVDESGLAALDAFMARLHPELREADDLEASWLGKGRGTVVRLAGILELLDWTARGSSSPPGSIGQDRMEAAVALWDGYFRPHARALFTRAAPSSVDCQARRVARWLRANGLADVTRERVRREALGRTVDAAGADRVLYRLHAASIVRPMTAPERPQGGRPSHRWAVNPALGRA